MGEMMRNAWPQGAYVYTIEVDGVVRYIGKGSRGRVFDHARNISNILNRRAMGEKVRTSGVYHRLIKAIGNQCVWLTRIVADGLSHEEAFQLEIDMIESFPPGQLWNARPGGLGGMSQAEIERRKSPEWRARQSEKMRVAADNPEYRKRRSKTSKDNLSLPHVAAGLEKGRTAEARARAAKSLSDRYQTPEGRAECSRKAKLTYSDPDKVARIRDGSAKAWADPEKRAARCAKIKSAWARRKEREAENVDAAR